MTTTRMMMKRGMQCGSYSNLLTNGAGIPAATYALPLAPTATPPVRCYARARKPPPPPPQPDPITGFLPNSRKGTIQPNDQIDLFEWAPFRVWTTMETNGFNIAPRYLRDWQYFLPEMMTIAPDEDMDEKPYIPEKAKLLGDTKINKEHILAGNFDNEPEETRTLYTALHHIAKDRESAKEHVHTFSEEVLKFAGLPDGWKSERNTVIDLQLGKTLVKGGDIDRLVYNQRGAIAFAMHEGVFDPTVLGYLDYGHHALMGYSLAITMHNYAIPIKPVIEEEQEQEVFLWNVKNHKISILRVNARMSVLHQLQKGQCPKDRTALCVWPQVEGYDFLVPEERTEFFIRWGRCMKYMQSRKALIGPHLVDPEEKARLAAEAAADLAAALARKPTYLPPFAPMPPELAKTIIPRAPPTPEEEAEAKLAEERARKEAELAEEAARKAAIDMALTTRRRR